jgi:hypothetical protein
MTCGDVGASLAHGRERVLYGARSVHEIDVWVIIWQVPQGRAREISADWRRNPFGVKDRPCWAWPQPVD